MKQTDMTCAQFSAALASPSPSPGGGGAAALCGSFAAGLGRMVAALSQNKKACAEHKEEIEGISKRLEELRVELIELVSADEEGFAPVTAAWAMDKADPLREQAVEYALYGACAAPINMMEALCEVLDLLARLTPVCSPLLISDAGSGATLCAGALRAAALNIYVNAGMMKQRERAQELLEKTDALLESATLGDDTFRFVRQKLSSTE